MFCISSFFHSTETAGKYIHIDVYRAKRKKTPTHEKEHIKDKKKMFSFDFDLGCICDRKPLSCIKNLSHRKKSIEDIVKFSN